MKKILVNIGVRYDKIALIEDNKLIDFYVEDHSSDNHVDNIYFGIVKDSVKKMESVFIDIGENKNAFMQLDNTDKLPLEGEKVLVQVIKDDTETKGVAVSKNLSLVGRYVVIVVNNSGKNIPKDKIMFSNDFEKSKAKDIRKGLEDLEIDDNMGIIIRHEAANASINFIKEDFYNIKNKLNDIYDDFEKFKEDKKDKNVRCKYKKNVVDIIINEFYDNEVESIIIDDKEIYQETVKRKEIYNLPVEITFFEKQTLSLFELHKVEEELKKALGRYAWLKSGGQIIIEHTEALTVIDVNSSKFEGKKKIEESSLKVNLEAASEIARQIRLRNISGIIIVDFINMKSEENRKQVITRLKEAVKGDKLKVNVLGMTSLGLVEMTRQKKRKMLKDILKNK